MSTKDPSHNVRKGSFFQRLALPLTKLVDLLYYWSVDMLAQELHIRFESHFQQSYIDWYRFVHNVCSTDLIANPSDREDLEILSPLTRQWLQDAGREMHKDVQCRHSGLLAESISKPATSFWRRYQNVLLQRLHLCSSDTFCQALQCGPTAGADTVRLQSHPHIPKDDHVGRSLCKCSMHTTR